MNYKVEATPQFLADAKRLSKKYASFKNDLAELTSELFTNPTKGISLGKDFYKMRLAITSKGKGKSGGARVITCVIKIQEVVYLAAVYDKSEKDSMNDKELKELVKEVTEHQKSKR